MAADWRGQVVGVVRRNGEGKGIQHRTSRGPQQDCWFGVSLLTNFQGAGS